MPERLLTPEEVADLLQLKPNTVRMFLREGRIPAVKIGNVWRVRPSDLDAYLDTMAASRSAAARKANDTRGPEGRSEASRKANRNR